MWRARWGRRRSPVPGLGSAGSGRLIRRLVLLTSIRVGVGYRNWVGEATWVAGPSGLIPRSLWGGGCSRLCPRPR